MTGTRCEVDGPNARGGARWWVRRKRILYTIFRIYAVLSLIVVRFGRPRTLSRLVSAEDPSRVPSAAAHTRDLAR